MKTSSRLAFLGGAACSALLAGLVAFAPTQDPPEMSAEDMQAAMDRVGAVTRPGPPHAQLERLLGKWTTETRFVGMGGMPAEQGTAEFRWLIDGRWLMSEGQGMLFGQPFQDAMILGYDNFKRSYVSCTVSTMDTAMRTSEGDLTRDGASLISYGTLDEYLTGEHDKMVKYAWRFSSPDRMVLEVHDLPIGETNTKVVEVVYTRAG